MTTKIAITVDFKDNVKVLENYRRLKNIRRCNNFPTLQTEDVAQHSFYVTVLAMTLAEEYNAYAREHNLSVHPLDVENVMDVVSVEDVMKKALFHDIEESFTSDIPFNVKHHSRELNLAMKKCVADILDKVYQGCSVTLHSQRNYNMTCKDYLEGKFVAIADLLEGAWYCYQELVMGNSYIVELFRNYLDEIFKVEGVSEISLACPTFNATINLFKDSLSGVKGGGLIV